MTKTEVPGLLDDARAFLVRRSRLVSVGIVLAVILPTVAVALQIAPVASSLPSAPDFRMWETRNATSLRLSDFRGKVVFLDLMATWCRTCRESMPDLLNIHQRYANASFVLLSVTTWPADSLTLMEKFRTNYSANWTFAVPFDPVQVGADYHVAGWPTYALVDREGRITYRAEGLVPLDTMVSHIDKSLQT